MTARRSSGILLFRRGAAGLELLLAHPGGPYFVRKDAGCWTIPKGQPDGEDDLWHVAVREFAEETGQPLERCRLASAEPIELGSITLGSGKVVHGWAVEGDMDPAALASNEFEVEWPPRSGRQQRYPEIDRAAWFPPDEARLRIHPAQAAFVDRLEEALGQR